MKGNTIDMFISDLCANGGPEKEFIYSNKYYIIQADNKNDDKTYLRLDIYACEQKEAGEYIETIWFAGESLRLCVEAFEKAKLFEGKTIYDVEKDIEVLFG